MRKLSHDYLPPRRWGAHNPIRSIGVDPPEVKDARMKLIGHLAKHKPKQPITIGCRLFVKWCFPRGRHGDGEYRITKPDTVV